MKFQKGSKVEVMNKTELPTSWYVAEVVSGNKHTYNLRYDCYPGVEKVSREFIRPCPPHSEDLQYWVAGDIVEVFDNNSWKPATVCEVSDGGHFSLRPHGFAREINVQKSNVRTRQTWKDGQWVPIVKISGSSPIPLPDTKLRQENDVGLQEFHVVSSKTLKRASPFCSFYLEASPGNPKKSKSEPKDSGTDQCSIGSCSVSSNGSNIAATCQETAAPAGDAASFNTSSDEDEGIESNIHRLELNAYRSTLDALYVSGPLNWEKEALLTNLRITLHISNDEHLTELRHLISVGSSCI